MTQNTSFDTTKNQVTGTLLYACIQKPVANYDKTGREFKISVVVDEETADIWNENFQKQEAKVVLTSKFKEMYKIDAPTDGKKQYVITIRKDELLANGEPVPDIYKPKVFVKNSQTGKIKDITQDKLVGNGSFGTVSLDIYENKYGKFARLKNVLVTDLIEYESSGEAGSEFGDVESDGSEFDSATPSAPPTPKKADKPKSKAKVEDDSGDDDAPF